MCPLYYQAGCIISITHANVYFMETQCAVSYHQCPKVLSRENKRDKQLAKQRNVCVCARSLNRIFVTPQTVTHQVPSSMEFSRQEYWSGFPIPTPGDLPNSGIKPTSCASPALAGGFVPLCHWEAILPTQGSKPGLLHCRIFYSLSHQEVQTNKYLNSNFRQHSENNYFQYKREFIN